MNKLDIQNITQRASFDGGGIKDFSFKSAEAADAIHAYRKRGGNRPIIPLEHAAAFVKWQALQFDGEFDLKELQEAFEFLKPAIIVYGGTNELQTQSPT